MNVSTQKHFYVTAEMKIINKPEWIDNFEKYDDDYQYHVTLKLPTAFNHLEKATVLQIIEEITPRYSPIAINFSKIVINETNKGFVIMITAEANKDLTFLQKELSKSLSKIGNCLSPNFSEYEKNFIPHITIARHLNDEQLKQAQTELENKSITLQVILDTVVATFVYPEKQTIEYRFKLEKEIEKKF